MGSTTIAYNSYEIFDLWMPLISALIGAIIGGWFALRAGQQQIDKSKEFELRPIILRHGYIQSWEKIEFKYDSRNILIGEQIQLTVTKGIATNISGHIVIGNKKYTLIFGGDISRKNATEIIYHEKWGWMNSNTTFLAMFKPDIYEISQEENHLRINYKDIEGKEYYTIESKDFIQESFPVKR